MSTKDQRLRMAKAIIDFEARRDSNGHFKIYKLPAGDGGGTYEVAGINDRYDPVQAAALAQMVEDGKFAEAENYAAEYIAKNTDPAAPWHKDPGVEFYLRDCVFNRGVRGATRILQLAVGVRDDGEIGPDTQHALTMFTPAAMLDHLREAREQYELKVVGRREQFWTGLVNRWDKSLVTARKFQAEAPAPVSGESWWTVILDMVLSFFKSPPKSQAKDTTPPWMPWALNEVGFHEIGANRNIGRYTGPAKCGSEGDPWCAIFANAAFESVGIAGSRSAMARSFERHPNFIKLEGPAYGAVTTMWRGSPDSGTGHVFFYVGESSKGILALGGNQSDQVCRQYEPRNRIVGYFWPKGQPLPKIGKILVDNQTSTEGTET